MAGKRKRHKKKPDLAKAKITLAKKRGKTILQHEVESGKTLEELQKEFGSLKAAKRELRLAKERSKRQPAPIAERKALDDRPVDAGHRADSVVRHQALLEKKAARAAKLERIERLRGKRQKRASQEVDLFSALGKDFFATGDAASDPSAEVAAAAAAAEAPAASASPAAV